MVKKQGDILFILIGRKFMRFNPSIIIYETPCNLLEEIANKIIKEGENDFGNILIIFPNKRPILYLKKILAEKIKRSFVLPLVFSFQEFAFKILNEKFSYEFIDLLDAVYILRNILEKENLEIFKKEKFSEFFPWGIRIIKAIDELEMNDVDFKKVKELKEYAEVPEKVKLVLEKIEELREKFYKEILKRDKITRGLLFRKLTEIDFDLNFEKIIFAGFYAFLPLEEYFIKKVMDKCSSEILFIKTREERAIREFIIRNNFKFETVKSEIKKPEIKFIKVKDFYSQGIFLRESLKKILEENIEPIKVGIILPDPYNLEGILGELGTELKFDFNVSMGYSFKLTPSFSFIKKFLEVKREIKDKKIYYRSFLSFLRHPFISSIFLDEVAKVEEKIKKENKVKGKIYFDLEEIIEESFEGDFVKILSFFLQEIKSICDFINVVKEILGIIDKKIKEKENVLFSIFLKEGFEIFEKILRTEIAKENFDIEDISKILLYYLSLFSIPLKGDPLRGFQIIGVLEARLVPFERVFFLDLIEGIYPKSYKYDPLIPEGLRKILGLPSYKENEAIYAYNFYQIVENAKEVYLLFYEKEKDVDSPESRFIQRLLWEKEKEEKKLLYDSIPFYTYTPLLTKESKKVIKKDEKIMESLYKKAEEGFHVTEIDEYIKCPFRFYELSILRNLEEEEIVEDIEGKSLGVFLHEVMEGFYRENFLNKIPDWNEYTKDKFLKFISEKFEERFGKEKESLWIRKEYLIFKMGRFINKLRGEDRGVVKKLEEKIEYYFDIESNLKVKIKGKIDRVDEFNDYYRIIDYKTSKGKLSIPERPENLADRREIASKVKSIQVPLYAFILSDLSNKNGLEVKRGSYYILGDCEVIDFVFGEEKRKKRVSLEETQILLKNILREIFDKEVPFEPDSKTGDCEYCPYMGICGEF